MGVRSLRERLCQRLAEVGVAVAPEAIYPAKGGARSSPTADCYRWEAHGSIQGASVVIASFDTMTNCARFGIDPNIGTRRWGFEISACSPADVKPKDKIEEAEQPKVKEPLRVAWWTDGDLRSLTRTLANATHRDVSGRDDLDMTREELIAELHALGRLLADCEVEPVEFWWDSEQEEPGDSEQEEPGSQEERPRAYPERKLPGWHDFTDASGASAGTSAVKRGPTR